MEAIILAGGLGTRLRDVIADKPKCMAPINGRPFLEILLKQLVVNGFNRIILSLGYKAEDIISYFGNSFGDLELVYEVEDSPLGTGGAIRAALTHCLSDHAFVFNGDTYLNIEASKIEQRWQKNRRPIMVIREIKDTGRFGRIDVNEDKVIAFLEKQSGGAGFINAGCYVLPKELLDDFPLNQKFSFETDYLEKFIASVKIDYFITQADFIDIGVPEDYARAQIEIAGI